jgi:peptide/nickel transport system substrate-binding protein
LALVAAVTAFAHPQRSGVYGGTLYVGLTGGEPDTLDPALARGGGGDFGPVLRTFCEGLYDINSDLRIVPWLAAAMPVVSTDKLTYTIALRRGVEFNDGTPFDAQAVVTTLRRNITLPGSVQALNLAAVDSVSATGPYTVVIHLKSRFTPLPVVLTGNAAMIVSPTQLAKLGANFGTDPICVGPFMYDNRVVGDSITVIKSPYYYDKYAVHLDKIVFKVSNDAPAATAALKAGDIQVLPAIDSPELPAIQQDSGLRVLEQTTLGHGSIIINIGNANGVGHLPYTNVGSPLASSAKLRQAFEEAIDRNILSKILSPIVLPGCTPIAPRSPWYDRSIRCTPYDPVDAKKLVAHSGFSNPTVHLLTSSATSDLRTAQVIQSQEAAVGIKVVIDTTDSVTALARAVSGSFDTFLVGSPGNIDPGLFLAFRNATSGPGNYSGYSNPRLDLILANAFRSTSKQARLKLYHVAQEILLADRPVIYLYHPIRYAAVSTSLKGVQLVLTQIRVAFAQFT